MTKKRILVTGAGGVVGSALTAYLQAQNHEVIALSSRTQCDLTAPSEVNALFQSTRPELVYHLAASVYGVGGNMAFPADIIYQNLLINTHIIEACKAHQVRKIVAMGTAAMYADGLQQPLREADVLAGEPHGSEAGYAWSKRAMLAQLRAYEQQYGLAYAFVIATNMYGPHDKFDKVYGHVVPSLLRKFLDAERDGGSVEIWGNGTPTRDFLYAEDAARGMVHLMEKGAGAYNLASGTVHTIKELVEEVAKNFPSVAYHWNVDKPLGQLTRAYDVSNMRALGFEPQYSLAAGIKKSADWVRANANDLRS